MEILDLCSSADDHIEELVTAYMSSCDRLRQANKRPTLKPTASVAQPRSAAPRPVIARGPYTSPIPDQPPRLPPLPFEKDVDADKRSGSDVPRGIWVGDVRNKPTVNQSFSAVEDHVGRRNHRRSATMASVGYVAEPVGLGLSQRNGSQLFRSQAVSARRKGSSSQVPRVFTGYAVEPWCYKILR